MNKGEKKYSTSPGAGVVVNGKKMPSSRKRKIPAWARGYVKKVYKRKKIMFEDTPTEAVTKSSPSEPVVGIDLEKFQEFETEANSVLNGHAALFDNTDSENDSVTEKLKEAKGALNESTAEAPTAPDATNSMDVTITEETKLTDSNVGSSSSSRRESTDDLTFAIESDSCPAEPGDIDKVVVDKSELESAWQKTVDMTREFSVEVLCDVYVQLSRCVGKFAQTYDRKSLPKVTTNYFFVLC